MGHSWSPLDLDFGPPNMCHYFSLSRNVSARDWEGFCRSQYGSLRHYESWVAIVEPLELLPSEFQAFDLSFQKVPWKCHQCLHFNRITGKTQPFALHLQKFKQTKNRVPGVRRKLSFSKLPLSSQWFVQAMDSRSRGLPTWCVKRPTFSQFKGTFAAPLLELNLNGCFQK